MSCLPYQGIEPGTSSCKSSRVVCREVCHGLCAVRFVRLQYVRCQGLCAVRFIWTCTAVRTWQPWGLSRVVCRKVCTNLHRSTYVVTGCVPWGTNLYRSTYVVTGCVPWGVYELVQQFVRGKTHGRYIKNYIWRNCWENKVCSHLRTYPPLDFKKTPLVQSLVERTAFSDHN